MKHRLESRLPGEIPITSDMEMTPQRLLMKVKEENKTAGLKLNSQKTKIIANRWGNNGNSD